MNDLYGRNVAAMIRTTPDLDERVDLGMFEVNHERAQAFGFSFCMYI